MSSSRQQVGAAEAWSNYVDGIARDERARIAETRALGKVPEGSGPEIVDAPARGPVVQFMPMKGYPDGEKGYKFEASGHMGRKAIQHADAFDLMANGAAKNKKASPFTPAQVQMGRDYASLFEKHDCAGVRCSSMEAAPDGGGGGGGGGEYIDAVIADGERLAVLRRRIGGGMAKVIRRRRPSDGRIEITDRRLVDAVCIGEMTLTQVLIKNRWPKTGRNVADLAVALAGALDRMAGPVREPRSASVMYGQQGVSPFA